MEELGVPIMKGVETHQVIGKMVKMQGCETGQYIKYRLL